MNRSGGLLLSLIALVSVGCAVRLGGPQPREYVAVAMMAGSDVTSAAAVESLRSNRASVALIAAEADSAWFAALAEGAGLSLSGPGWAGRIGLAFLAGEALGDTTIALHVAGGADLVVHDALYRVDRSRYLDLMAFHLPDDASPRDAARAFLEYVATDVMKDAAVILTLTANSFERADSMADLLGPAFLDSRRCLADSDPELGRIRRSGVRLLFGPELRIRCEDARYIGGAPEAVTARLVVRR